MNSTSNIQIKFFNKNGEVIFENEMPSKKFRFMREYIKLEKNDINLKDIDIEESIAYMNENNKNLKIKSIMVIDDEYILRDLYTEQLGRLSHYVEAYDNAQEALSEFSKNPLKYDFILSDNIMPQMKGDEFADRIKAIKPDIPIFIITGDADSVNEESFNNSVSGVIQKPIDSMKLQNFVGSGKVEIFSLNNKSDAEVLKINEDVEKRKAS